MMKIRYFSVCLIAMLAVQQGVWSQADDAQRYQEVIDVLAQAVAVEPELAQPEASDDLPLIGEIPVEGMVKDRQQIQRQIQQLQQQVQRQNQMINVLPRREPSNGRSDVSGGFGGGGYGGGGFGVESYYGGRAVPDLPAIDWEKDANVQIRVFQMQHAPVEAILPIMQKLFSGKLNISMHPSNRSLIVVGDESGFKLFEDVLNTLDTEPIEPEPIQTSDMALRVYAIENQSLASNDDKVLERFIIEIDGKEGLNINKLFSLTDASFSINSLNHVKENTYVIEMLGYEKGISGRACSLIEEELDVTAILNQVDIMGAAENLNLQTIPIPSSVQPTLKNLLGNTLHVTGYWFGNTSMPGTVEAPLGDWKLILNSADGQDDGFRLDVSVFEQGGGNRSTTGSRVTSSNKTPSSGIGIRAPSFHKTLSGGSGMMGGSGFSMGHSMDMGFSGNNASNANPYMSSLSENNSLILQNAVTGRIGRPIIIGYNRRDNGQNRLGALVIIPEREFGGGIGGANQQDAGAINSIFEQSAN